MAYSQAQALLAARGVTPGLMRIGTIASVSATQVTVMVNATEIPAAYLDSYAPVAGDLVAVFQQDSTWFVLGRLAGSGINQVDNASFENQGSVASTNVTTAINNWVIFYQVGAPTATMSVVQDDNAPAGSFVAQIDPVAVAKTIFLQSSMFDVEAGETYSMSVYAGGVNLTTALLPIDLLVLGFATATAVAPAQTATTLVQTMNVDNAPPYTQVSGNWTVPAGHPAFVRFAIRTSPGSGLGARFDFAVFRKGS
jgi:hypothetical protein